MTIDGGGNPPAGRRRCGSRRARRARRAPGLLAGLALGLLVVLALAPGRSGAQDGSTLATGQVLPNPSPSSIWFGTTMARSGDWLAVVAPAEVPAVELYTRDGPGQRWRYSHGISPESPGDPGWGRALAFDFPHLVVSNADSVFWYTLDVATSSEPTFQLVAGVTGRGDDDLGAALAFAPGHTLLIGAPDANDGETMAGRVYPARLIDGELIVLDGQSLSPDGRSGDRFGSAIAVGAPAGGGSDGPLATVWVGAPGDDDGGDEAGAVHRFHHFGGAGFEAAGKITDFDVEDRAGAVLAADPVIEELLAVGLPNAGLVRTFQVLDPAGAVPVASPAGTAPPHWLALHDGLLAVGQPVTGTGFVEVYQWLPADPSWDDTPRHDYVPTGTGPGDLAGAAVLIDADPRTAERSLIVSAPRADGGAGEVHIAPVAGDGEVPPAGLRPGLAIDAGWAALGDPAAAVVHLGRFVDGRWVDAGRLTGPPGSGFGAAVALDGTVLAVGSPLEGRGSGGLRIYVRGLDGAFGEVPPPPDGYPASGRLGASVDVKDGLVVAGAPNAAEGQGAVVAARLAADRSGLTTIRRIASNGVDDSGFGGALAIASGDRLWIGAGDEVIGRVALYEPSDGTWIENADGGLNALDALPGRFGASLDADGARLVVGHPDPSAGGGAALYYRNAFQGGLDDLLIDPDRDSANFGVSVAISGDIVTVGADGGRAGQSVYSELGFGTGLDLVRRIDLGPGDAAAVSADGPHHAATVVPADGAVDGFGDGSIQGRDLGPGDGQSVKLVSPVGSEDDRFGWAVALQGDTLAVLSPGAERQPTVGAIEVFRRLEGAWTPVQALLPTDGPGAPVALTTDVALAPDGTLAVLADGVVRTFARTGPAAPYRPADSVPVPGGRRLTIDDQHLAVAAGTSVAVFAHRGGAGLVPLADSPVAVGLPVWSLALDGDRLATGAFAVGEGGPFGVAGLHQLPSLDPLTEVTGEVDGFATAVDLDGDTLVVGAATEVAVYALGDGVGSDTGHRRAHPDPAGRPVRRGLRHQPGPRRRPAGGGPPGGHRGRPPGRAGVLRLRWHRVGPHRQLHPARPGPRPLGRRDRRRPLRPVAGPRRRHGGGRRPRRGRGRRGRRGRLRGARPAGRHPPGAHRHHGHRGPRLADRAGGGHRGGHRRPAAPGVGGQQRRQPGHRRHLAGGGGRRRWGRRRAAEPDQPDRPGSR